ncbi:MAG: hypothetical protein ACRELG_27315 [Gemmataceae bacterium]
MTLPDDREARLRRYRHALRNEADRLTKYPGRDSLYVLFKKRPQEWLRTELAEYSLGEIIRLLHKYVEAGGELDEVKETREGYTHHEFHYDMRVTIGGRPIYFETALSCEDAEDPDGFTIVVVNAKDV